MNTEKDINEEYERIFGKATQINLFDSSEEYDILRKEILSHPQEVIKKKSLPFQDIEVLPFKEYIWESSIENAKAKGFRVFYIKQRSPYCRAAGYYDKKNGDFVLLKSSYIVSSNNFDPEDSLLLVGRRKLLMSKSKQEGNKRYLTEDVKCSSPFISASYVLGIKTSIIEWEDEKGKSIISFFPELRYALEREERKSQEKEAEEINRKSEIYCIVQGLKLHLQSCEQKHLFYISEKDICKAQGYLDPESKYFFIQRNSLVSKEADLIYATSESGKSRQRFLDKVCKLKDNFYLVTKDAKCRSAAAAACYVLGRKVDFLMWRDSSGMSLQEIYPDRFFSTDPNTLSPAEEKPIDESQRVFYIEKIEAGEKICSASGTYDKTSGQFLIRKGSILCYNVSSDFRYTVADFQRQKFIKLNCVKQSYGYVLKRDALCDSPNAAASFVLGRTANGWIEWKNDKKHSLNLFSNRASTI